ncbi:hypothetical protein CFRS1_v003850 [Colletotrichum fructicola]|nr:hypothetical protein CFRS1_v003850 [Colletotrichum fructicola]
MMLSETRSPWVTTHPSPSTSSISLITLLTTPLNSLGSPFAITSNLHRKLPPIFPFATAAASLLPLHESANIPARSFTTLLRISRFKPLSRLLNSARETPPIRSTTYPTNSPSTTPSSSTTGTPTPPPRTFLASPQIPTSIPCFLGLNCTNLSSPTSHPESLS